MEKTMSLLDIIKSALKEWSNKKEEKISDEKILSGDLSDDEFAKIAKDMPIESILELQKNRNGIGVEKLTSGETTKIRREEKSFIKKVPQREQQVEISNSNSKNEKRKQENQQEIQK